MEIPKLGFEIVRKTKILMSHPLKEYLGVGCVTNTYTLSYSSSISPVRFYNNIEFAAIIFTFSSYLEI
jgi:hypothetical protein